MFRKIGNTSRMSSIIEVNDNRATWEDTESAKHPSIAVASAKTCFSHDNQKPFRHSSFRAQPLTEFSKKHQGHVGRLWTEAQDLVKDLEVVSGEFYRAKAAYEMACIEASRYASKA